MNIRSLIQKSKIFIFDLDRTIWECNDKFGEKIYAKHVLSPYSKYDEDCVFGQDSSTCTLHPGVRKVLSFLKENDVKIGFLSIGGLLDAKYEEQPSIKILKEFGIYDYFDYCTFLLYRTADKSLYLKDLDNCVFIDDDDKNLIPARELKNVYTVDRNSFVSWNELL